MKLSICMMVKNEEKNLPRCLEQLKPLTESGLAELIIIDTGSEDQSENIARQYTDKIYFHKWNKNFSEMRNISISYAKGEWIFIIDADERLNDVDKLITLMNSSELKRFNTILLQVKNLYYVTDESKYNLIASPRLFRNDGKFRYEGAVHNQPIFEGPNLSVDISLTHFGYITNDKELMELKYNRTTELLRAELKKEPENLYYMYQLGVSYDMHRDYKESLNLFRKAYTILNKRSLEEKKVCVYIYASYSRIAYTNGKFEESIKVAKEALNFEKDYIDLYYLLGISEKQLRNNEESVKYFNKYLDLAKRYNQLEISKDMSIIMYHIDDKSKSIAYFEIVKYHLELEKYKDAYKIYKNITNANEKIYASINILIHLEKYLELRKVYNSFTSEKDKNNFLCTLEEKIKKIENSQKFKLNKEFSINEDVYGLFNKIRTSNNVDDKISLTKLFINEIDFNKAPVFYSEIFENVKDNIKLIINVFEKIETENLKSIIKFLVEQKEFAEIFENYILEEHTVLKSTRETKIFITIADVLMLLHLKDNYKVSEKYLNIFKSYINMGINFIQELYRVEKAEEIYKNISNPKDRFLMIMYIFNKLMKENNKKAAVKYMIEAVNTYEAFAKYIDIYKNESLNLQEEKVMQEQNKEFENYKLKVKQNINNLINQGILEEAKKLIYEYEEIVNQDLEICSMKAIVYIMEKKYEDAELILKNGLGMNRNNFELNYNLAYLYEQTGRFSDSVEYYGIAEKSCNDYNMKQSIKSIVDNIRKENPNLIINCRKKIAFFVKQGMDSFLADIIEGFSKEYEAKKIIVTNYNQIDDGMEWADICWFEWCDELIQYGSKHKLGIEKTVICRLHSYEAFAGYATNVKWDVVDKIVFVGENIRKFTIDKYKIDKNKTVVIPNGVDINKYTFKERKAGFNIAYVGYVNYKKGPMLLLHTFKAIYDKDHRYKLYIAGQFQDDRDVLYYEQMIKEFGLENNVIYEGWQDNLDEWMENKNYILCTSVLESQNMSVMQAMSKGIKPIVHNFVGARHIYDNKYIWNTIDEARNILEDTNYNSKEYLNFVKNNYNLENALENIKKILTLSNSGENLSKE